MDYQGGFPHISLPPLGQLGAGRPLTESQEHHLWDPGYITMFSGENRKSFFFFAVCLHGNTSKRNKRIWKRRVCTRRPRRTVLFQIRNALSRKRALGRPGTYGDGLEQRLLVLPPELGSDLLQVHLTAGNYDPGHHLLLRTFALRTERQSVSVVNVAQVWTSCPAIAMVMPAYLHGFTESVGKVELSVLEALHCEETFEDEPFLPSSEKNKEFSAALPRVRKDFSRSPFTSFLMLSLMSYGL